MTYYSDNTWPIKLQSTENHESSQKTIRSDTIPHSLSFNIPTNTSFDSSSSHIHENNTLDLNDHSKLVHTNILPRKSTINRK